MRVWPCTMVGLVSVVGGSISLIKKNLSQHIRYPHELECIDDVRVLWRKYDDIDADAAAAAVSFDGRRSIVWAFWCPQISLGNKHTASQRTFKLTPPVHRTYWAAKVLCVCILEQLIQLHLIGLRLCFCDEILRDQHRLTLTTNTLDKFKAIGWLDLLVYSCGASIVLRKPTFFFWWFDLFSINLKQSHSLSLMRRSDLVSSERLSSFVVFLSFLLLGSFVMCYCRDMWILWSSFQWIFGGL